MVLLQQIAQVVKMPAAVKYNAVSPVKRYGNVCSKLTDAFIEDHLNFQKQVLAI